MGIFRAVCLLTVVSIKEADFMARNIALGKPAIQSSVTMSGTADRAVDGNKDSKWTAGSCIHTQHGKWDQWWMVDLQGVYNITDVWIQNRGDRDGYKFHDFVVEVFTGNPLVCQKTRKTICNTHPGTAGLGENVHMQCKKETFGRYVRVLKMRQFINIHMRYPRGDVLIICEVEVDGNLVHLVSRDYRYIKYEGKRMSTNNQTVIGMTRLECSILCAHDNSCNGINLRSDGGCQLVSQLHAVFSLTADPSWDYFARCT